MFDVSGVTPPVALLGESPAWFERDQTVRWVDILSGRQHAYGPTGHDVVERSSDCISVVAPSTTGRTLVAIDGHVEIFGSTDVDRSIIHVDLAEGERFNDGKVGPDGDLYIGTTFETRNVDAARMFRISNNERPDVLLTGLTVSNGLDWFSNGDMAFVDSPRRRVSRIEFDELRRPFRWQSIVECRPDWGLPDGLTIDADENVWVAFHGGAALRCFSPTGQTEAVVDLPVSQPTCPAFGGPDLRTLFVTSARAGLDDAGLDAEPLAGALLAVETDVVGRPCHRFRDHVDTPFPQPEIGPTR